MVFVSNLVEGEVIFEDVRCLVVNGIVGEEDVTLFDDVCKFQQVKGFEKRATIFLEVGK